MQIKTNIVFKPTKIDSLRVLSFYQIDVIP
jgi:hypothetical protein